MKKLTEIHFLPEHELADEREEKNTWKGFVIAFVISFLILMVGGITGSNIIVAISVFIAACATALSMVLLYVSYERWRENRKA